MASRTPGEVAAAKAMRRINQALYVVWRYTHDEAQRAEAAALLLNAWREEHHGVVVAGLCEACGYRQSDLRSLVLQEQKGLPGV